VSDLSCPFPDFSPRVEEDVLLLKRYSVVVWAKKVKHVYLKIMTNTLLKTMNLDYSFYYFLKQIRAIKNLSAAGVLNHRLAPMF
jgi:hypothetical protein